MSTEPDFKPVPLAGSEKQAIPGNKYQASPREEMMVTVVMGDKAGDQEYEHIEEFAKAHHLEVLESNKITRMVLLNGSAGDMQEAFNVQLENASVDGIQARVRSGAISIPQVLDGHVLAVLGLDNRPAVFPRLKLLSDITPRIGQNARSYTLAQIKKAYNVNPEFTGKGVTIAIACFGGGYTPEDLGQFWEANGITEPPVVEDVSVLGAVNSPGDEADGEVTLDVEVAGAVAPGSRIVVYHAPNTDQGYFHLLMTVAGDTERKPNVLSTSWGQMERGWTRQAIGAVHYALEFCATNKISSFAAAGDSGASDDGMGLNVDYPASDWAVTGVGGTSLYLNEDGTTARETAWNDQATGEGASGGGISGIFEVPEFQKKAGVPIGPDGFTGRGVPDVSLVADPLTGYRIVLDNREDVIGGTSAGAPFWAGLAACQIEKRGGRPIGLLNSELYRLTDFSVFRDITVGSNIDPASGIGWETKKGWDALTGLGTPDATRLSEELDPTPKAKAPAPAPKASDKPTERPAPKADKS